uniref:PiggyBac transposable element-derived protein domain-containing protein n=1 Tax=Myripristis murdjan TaxID=586833 RepID=A0A667ZA88_9TELE
SRGQGRRRGAGDQERTPTNQPAAASGSDDREWHEINWQPKNINFTANPGPVKDAAALDSDKPADYVQLFISDELIQDIVDQTNLYANQYIQNEKGNSPHSRIHAWKPVTVSEMKNFLGLFFLTGIIRKHDIEMYWSTEEMLATPYFNKVMSRNRFEIIWRFLHFSDNKARPANDTDRLYKVLPVLDYLVSKFREMYQPSTNICIDEGMLLWRGHLAFRSYILCDSDTWYCYNMKPYCGEGAALEDTVIHLLDRLAGRGYRLFMDNFHNSVALSKHLLDLKIHVCGTLRKNKGEPPRIMRHNDSVMVLAWRDKKIVKMITTFHENNMEDIQVWQRGHKGKVRVQKPACIVEYNKAMNGVDKLDQNIVYYPFVRKSHKWTKKFVTYLFQISLFNAFVIYKAKNPQGKSPYNTDPGRRLDRNIANHALVPILPTPKKQHPTRRCRVCSRKGLRRETSYCCAGCGVPLYFGECYTLYHSKAHYQA